MNGLELSALKDENNLLKSTLARITEVISTTEGAKGLEEIREILERTVHPKTLKSSTKRIPVSIDASSGGEYSVFGPTSAFHNVMDMSARYAPGALSNDYLSASPQVTRCVANFFKWLYPDITVFVHRESFLSEFLQPGGTRGYCSDELIYSIAALGARCAESQELRDLSLSFFQTARNKIFDKKILVPQINTLQALLCLSLYELGDGNASASWMLSGMAIRMGYDLGFQLNPKDWAIEPSGDAREETYITNMDIMVRSRIYWGCYIVDHFVSLIMGRPVTVRRTEASIPSSEVLPDSRDIEEFIFGAPGCSNLDASQTIEALCSLSENVGALLAEIFSSESSDDTLSYLNIVQLKKFNTALTEWRRRLPVALRWNKLTKSTGVYNPTVMNYRFFYYIVILCLNRPFLGKQLTMSPSPDKICKLAISELAGCLSSFNSSMLPPSILIVYLAILATSVALLQVQEASRVSDERLRELAVLYHAITMASTHWQLATKSMIFIRKKVRELQIAPICEIFKATEEAGSQTVPQSLPDDALNWGLDFEAWAAQDNLFANFFELAQ